MDTQTSERPVDVACVVCHTYTRPWDVPWTQHVVGCSVRCALQRRELEARSVMVPSARLAAAA